jgi:pilus assembly protein CpaB
MKYRFNEKGILHMKRKIRLIIINAAILAFLIIFEIVVIRSMTGGGATTQVVFVKEKISAKSIITADMLEVKRIDTKLVNGSYVISAAEAVGKRVIHDMAAGEILFISGLSNGMPSNNLEFENPDNRLFALELKGDEANGWWLDAEQRADIIFVPGNEKSTARANTLENIRIAAILDEKGNIIEYSSRVAPPRYVCLEVTADQAEFLAYAKINGKIELAVRSDTE